MRVSLLYNTLFGLMRVSVEKYGRSATTAPARPSASEPTCAPRESLRLKEISSSGTARWIAHREEAIPRRPLRATSSFALWGGASPFLRR